MTVSLRKRQFLQCTIIIYILSKMWGEGGGGAMPPSSYAYADMMATEGEDHA